MSLNLSSYKGTRDLYPADMRLRQYIFNKWRTAVESFGYEEYMAPTLEPLELYAAKSGQEIVNEETYQFEDRGGRRVAIRPEMTPSVARMVAARRQETPIPARLFSIANFMRYERPQKGREREFWQLNFDLFGVDNSAADIEILELSHSIVKAFGATDEMFTLRVNDRRLTNFIMKYYLNLDDSQSGRMIKLLDHRAKISEESFVEQVREIAPDDADETLAKFDQLLSVTDISQLPTEIIESSVSNPLGEILETLKNLGISNAKFDLTLMRGFDYYTGIVFEIFDEHPDNRRAMFGGGRYDGLVGLFGVEDMPVVGAAPGETMFAEFLKSHDLIPELKPATSLVLIPLGDVDIMQIANEIRQNNVNVAVDFTNRKVEKKIKSAIKAGAEYVLFIGENELREQTYSLKELSTGEENRLTVEQIIATVSQN